MMSRSLGAVRAVLVPPKTTSHWFDLVACSLWLSLSSFCFKNIATSASSCAIFLCKSLFCLIPSSASISRTPTCWSRSFICVSSSSFCWSLILLLFSMPSSLLMFCLISISTSSSCSFSISLPSLSSWILFAFATHSGRMQGSLVEGISGGARLSLSFGSPGTIRLMGSILETMSSPFPSSRSTTANSSDWRSGMWANAENGM
mmetsp:Transcript_19125/g.39832  ORF Transcript_19125/g.39832 Transcript_19125/m.39832 type:complete len:203 (-) Transcript_19125:68-676(-)